MTAATHPGVSYRAYPESSALRQVHGWLELDARAHDDGLLAGQPEVFGGVSGDP